MKWKKSVTLYVPQALKTTVCTPVTKLTADICDIAKTFSRRIKKKQVPSCEINIPNMSLLHPLTTLHFSLISIINRRNRTNGTFLLGHFYDCIFSQLFIPTHYLLHRNRALSAASWGSLYGTKTLPDYICIPSICNTRASHYRQNALPCQRCVFFHLFLFMFESSRWDGRWRHHNRLCINT